MPRNSERHTSQAKVSCVVLAESDGKLSGQQKINKKYQRDSGTGVWGGGLNLRQASTTCT